MRFQNFSPTHRRIVLLMSALLAIMGFFMFDLNTYLSYQALAENEAWLKAQVRAAPLVAALIYMAVYIVVVALSLPGALWLTLSGGLLFGTLIGGTLTVFAATIGACLLFLAARFLVGDMLRTRFGARTAKFEAAFNRDAVSYLLVLRLVPIFPFFIVNLGAALVGARFSIFALTTFFGIMPATFVFASIGNGISVVLQAGSRPDLSIITQPQIILPLLAFAALSLTPIIWRRIKPKQEKENPHG